MTHIVTLRRHETDPDLLYLCTPPDMSHVMGGFGPARFVRQPPQEVPDASYLLASDDLPRFLTYAQAHSVHVSDGRVSAARHVRQPWQERPLPECRECGQPRARHATRIHTCPRCGETWLDA